MTMPFLWVALLITPPQLMSTAGLSQLVVLGNHVQGVHRAEHQ